MKKSSFLLGLLIAAVAMPGAAFGDVKSSAHHAVGGKIQRVYHLKQEPDFLTTKVVVMSASESKVRGEGVFAGRRGKMRKFRYWCKVNNTSGHTRDVGYEMLN